MGENKVLLFLMFTRILVIFKRLGFLILHSYLIKLSVDYHVVKIAIAFCMTCNYYIYACRHLCVCACLHIFPHLIENSLRGVVFDFLKAKLMSVHTTQKTPRHKEAEILSLPLYLVDNEDERID